MNHWTFLLAAVAMAACGCGSSGPSVQPTPVGDPIINCPSDVSVTAHNGQTPAVSFDTPTALQGSPPVTVVCTPASGTAFKNGITAVTCVATDSRAHTAGCSFNVVVTPVPQLLKTTFMAFGDSVTEGKTTLRGRGAVSVPPNIVDFSGSYVDDLNAKLVARYQDQFITIIADGIGGQQTGPDKFRLTADLDRMKPDALLLLEGTNDVLNGQDQATINSAGDALQYMVQQAKGRQVRVFLATLPPINPAATQPRTSPQILAAAAATVTSLNNRIRTVAAQESITLVDLNAALAVNFIGSDGVHPTADGYARIATEWLNAIVATLEARPSSLR